VLTVIAQNGDAQLYYESTGRGDPVLLVMGLGMAATAWWRTIPVLAKRFRVLAFDNRGAGRSELTRGPYTLAQLAADGIAVLDSAGEESAHVYGLSMGGMIAQELVLRYPERVRALVLGASSAGGASHQLPDRETLEFMRRRVDMSADEAAWAAVPYQYGSRTQEQHAERIAEDIARRLRFPIHPDGYRAQLAAAWKHDAAGRLRSVRAPTLVLHGSEDRIVPVANGRRLAELIPGASLEILDGAGHLYPTDEPCADREVLRFLVDCTVGPPPRHRAT
jgi:3-oxoadipate enol-lactonase